MNDKILVTQSSMPDYQEYVEEIKKIWDSKWLTNMGPVHNEFQSMLKEYLVTDNIELFTNGHMSLEISLQALELKGEVITTPFTFASTTHAISKNGLNPVFCDIKYSDFTIDESKIEALINENTCAIMPVHVYGNICNVNAIQKIADKYGLKVIYDAAHAFGEKYNGIGVSNFGDVSCYSFHATKVFNSIEGGAASYRDEDVASKVRAIRNFGMCGSEVSEIGTNAKMNEFCAAMGVCNLRHVDGEIQNRKALVEQYVSALSEIEGIKLSDYNPNTTYNYSYMPVVFEDSYHKNCLQVLDELAENNIFARRYFYPLTSDFDCYKNLGKNDTPVASYVAQRVLCLPLYADLSADDVARITDIIKR